MKRIAPALTCMLAAWGLACEGEQEVAEAEIARPVKTYAFGATDRERQLTYPGRVFPNTTVEVAFEVTGQIRELPVPKGQQVKQGELLARLDQRDFINELEAANARAEEALATRDRFRDAAKTRAVSRQEVDEAEASARQAVAARKIKEKQLEDTELRAKFDGIVADRYVENFQNVVAKEPILSLQDIHILEVRIDLPERDFGTAPEVENVGRLTASFDAISGREFELEVKEFVTDADPVTQTFPVTLQMPNPGDADILPDILPGMTASVTWYRPPRAGASDQTVPAIAVLGQEGRAPWVWVIDRDTMRVSRRPVEIGAIVQSDRIEVRGGLQPGELIASAGVHHLAEGMKVREFR